VRIKISVAIAGSLKITGPSQPHPRSSWTIIITQEDFAQTPAHYQFDLQGKSLMGCQGKHWLLNDKVGLLSTIPTETYCTKNGQLSNISLHSAAHLPIKNVPAHGHLHRGIHPPSRTVENHQRLARQRCTIDVRSSKRRFGCSDRVAVQNFDSVAWQPIGQICFEVPNCCLHKTSCL